ncbi:tyrosine-type recombinase/integrase [Paraburkholderia aspalathi]|uniref:tyrosine-type recombinase/integrase n=1 Tax=Paraburkholderia aspalathi TaxID=1324617 RepID=UPI0038BD58D7
MNTADDFIDVYGRRVLVANNTWSIVTSTGIERLSWSAIDQAGEPLASLCREYVRHELLTQSPIEAVNSHSELSGFARFHAANPQHCIQTSAHAYLAHLTVKKQRHRWSRIRSFCRMFAERNHPAFDKAGLPELNRIKVGGNKKGEAVRNLHETKGPLTRQESTVWRQHILADDDDSYAAVRERCVAILTTTLGLRPTTVHHIMESDFVINVTIDDQPAAFALDVPRAKKGTAPRVQFRRIALHEKLAREIQQLIALNRERFSAPVRPEHRPLFYAQRLHPEFGDAGYKESSTGIAVILRHAVQRYGVVSPRTGELIKLFPTRLRRTAATMLAREGYSPEQIAYFLDHEDLQQVGQYANATQGVVEHLDRAAASTYARYLSAFSGSPPKPSSTVTSGKTVSYVTEEGEHHFLGKCGQTVQCVLHAPFSCYRCEKFKPFSDAAHGAFQADLLNRRKKLSKARTLAERRLAPLLDETIYALALVQRLIEEQTDAS